MTQEHCKRPGNVSNVQWLQGGKPASGFSQQGLGVIGSHECLGINYSTPSEDCIHGLLVRSLTAQNARHPLPQAKLGRLPKNKTCATSCNAPGSLNSQLVHSMLQAKGERSFDIIDFEVLKNWKPLFVESL